MDAMQLELSNFQPLAANEAVEQEVQDLGGAEQVLGPIIEKVTRILLRSYAQSE
jgi:hypothetical protein